MTVTVVIVLSVVTIFLVIGALVIAARQDRTPRPEPPEDELPEPPEPEPDYLDPRTIKVGDTVVCQGARSRVLGALHLSQKGREWTRYLLDDGTRHYQWLSVQERPGATEDAPPVLEVVLWTPVPTQGMVPAKSMLTMEGVEFFPVDRGTLAFRSEGTTGLPDRGLLDFADYRAADRRVLSFMRVQGSPTWTAAYAHPLPPGSIQVERLPGPFH